jgi:hypothetical protein
MRKLLPTLLASGILTTASAALSFANNFGNVTSDDLMVNVGQLVVVPEPATNVLLICGLLTVGGLAIFLGQKLG